MVGDEVAVDEHRRAGHVGAVREVLGHAADGERALLHLVRDVVCVGDVALWVERRLERHVRRHAREEQRTPRVVHRQRVHLFEVAGRRHRPVEGAVELVDHLRRELLEVRLGVDNAVLGDLEQPRRLGQAHVAQLRGDDLLDAVLAPLDLLRLLADVAHHLLRGGLLRLEVLVQLLERRHLGDQRPGLHHDLLVRLRGHGERHAGEVVRVAQQQLLGRVRREDRLLHVRRRRAEGLDQRRVAALAQRLEHVARIVAQRRVRQLGQVRKVVVHRRHREARPLSVRRDVLLLEPVLHRDDRLRGVRLEQQRLDLEPPHEVGERLRRLLGLGDHRVRQRDLPIRLDEQHADVELHRHELGDAVSVLDDVEPLLEVSNRRLQVRGRRQRRRHPNRLIRRVEHARHHRMRERAWPERLPAALVGAHRRLVDDEHRLVRVHLHREPGAGRDVRHEHARRPNHLHVPLARALVREAARGLLDPLHAKPQLLLHLSHRVGCGGAAQAAQPGAGDLLVVHPRERDPHVVQRLGNLEVDAAREAAEDDAVLGKQLRQRRRERRLPRVGGRSEEDELRPGPGDRLEELHLGGVRLQELGRVPSLELGRGEQRRVLAQALVHCELDLDLERGEDVARVGEDLQRRQLLDPVPHLVLRLEDDHRVRQVAHRLVARLLRVLVAVALLLGELAGGGAHLLGELELPRRVEHQVLARLERLEPAHRPVPNLHLFERVGLCRLAVHDPHHVVNLDLRLGVDAAAAAALAAAALLALLALSGRLLWQVERQRGQLRPDVRLVAPGGKVVHLGEHVAEELAVRVVQLHLALGADLRARAPQHLGDRLLLVRERRLDVLPLHLVDRVHEQVRRAEPLRLGLRVRGRRRGSAAGGGGGHIQMCRLVVAR
mmetsp:Transcript_8547/g.25316  ORF Transcript_8547/g.25316 Transcript_8547/m.25316 type:complete len:888 (+) Transcript_8547:411-3074(+)